MRCTASFSRGPSTLSPNDANSHSFRRAFASRAIIMVLAQLLWIPLAAGVVNLTAVLVLSILAIAVDLLAAYTTVIRGMSKRRQAPDDSRSQSHLHFTPAVSLDHYSERNMLFLILVLGEMILNTTYTALNGETGALT